MSVLIISTGKDPEPWATALRNQHPGMEIHLYPEDHNKEDIDYVISWKHPRGIFKNYPNLKVIASMGAGVDHIISDPEIPEEVIITRVVDEKLADDMSDFVLALIMDHIRNISYHYSKQSWEPKPYKTPEFELVGIMGMGVLGKSVAKTLFKNGFNLSGWSRSKKEVGGINMYYGKEELDEFLEKTTILVCLLPLTPETENILNKDLFEKLPEGAYIINVARGEHLVEQDLIKMVDTGHLSGASLDVFRKEPLPEDHPFWKHSKIKVTPHIASITDPVSVVPQLVENYERMQEGEELQNVVQRKKGY